ncbi:MAG TPA: hypothetical protein DEA90_04815 [Opitutae bacterium]|nr:hypothetical protein [Puniceicoccaceae bacterium]HBR93467.1 hypothetical protein [Opitutae bacterium]|tara:strand:- start:5195 stop:7498 length:2304 start_codon:yes stop_codon:yes gene_type:complete
MKNVEVTEWAFGGWLRGLDHTAAVGILVGLFAVSIVCACFSYWSTLRPLSISRRIPLVGLRSLLFFLLFLCLANPTRVERQLLEPSGLGTLAVVVDVSDSMTMPDNRKSSRLDHASSLWKQWRGQAESAFENIHYFQLAKNTRPVDSFEAAIDASFSTGQTGFYQSAQLVTNAAAGDLAGLVYMTDALDTSGSSVGVDQMVAAAQERQLPVYFIPGVNRLKGADRVDIEKVKLPTRIVQRSSFEFEAVYRISSDRARSLPIRLFQNGKLVDEQQVDIRAGDNVRRWGVPIQVEDAGSYEIRLEVGAGDYYAQSVSEVQVYESLPKKVLIYLGALDWGYRYLADALHEDPRFEMDTIFGPSTGLRRVAFASDAPVLNDLPSAVSGLNDYDIVILLQPYIADISAAQQQALAAYARDGGAVLFAISNTEGSRQFAGTAIERMLPVVLDASEESAKDVATRNFQAAMRRVRGGENKTAETKFALAASQKAVLRPLSRLDAIVGSEFSTMFAQLPVELQSIAPEYFESARVEFAKAAAQVQSQVQADDHSNILFATQTFGSGKSSILTTDLFWRWHLSRPSDDPASSIFWQQMITWLARSTDRAVRITSAPIVGRVDEPLSFQITGGSDAVWATVQNRAEGTLRSLPVGAANEHGVHVIETDFAEAGDWILRVEDTETGAYARTFFAIQDLAPVNEAVVRSVDFETMKELALRTGGAVLQNGPPREWSTRTNDELLLDESVSLRWHQQWLLLAILLIYSTELILRRRARLL